VAARWQCEDLVMSTMTPGHLAAWIEDLLGLAEADGGIITQAVVLCGAPPAAPQVGPSLRRHWRQFGRAPRLLTGDRSCSTATVRRAATAAGVKQVALPHTRPPTPASRARERERWFQRGLHWSRLDHAGDGYNPTRIVSRATRLAGSGADEQTAGDTRTLTAIVSQRTKATATGRTGAWLPTLSTYRWIKLRLAQPALLPGQHAQQRPG